MSRDTEKKNMGIETKVVYSGNRDGQKHPIGEVRAMNEPKHLYL